MIGAAQFRKMKPTARLVNCARGGIVDESALVEALKAGEIAGAALDVFDTEPLPEDSPLRGAEGVVLTPHLGASTKEAQLKVAEAIAHQFVAYFHRGTIENAVNLSVTLDPRCAEFAKLAETLGRLAAQLTDKPVRQLTCRLNGKEVSEHARTLAVFVLNGLLGQGSAEPVNLVNAPYLARRRGMTLKREASRAPANFVNLISVEAETADGPLSVRGTLFDGVEPRIVGLWEYPVEFRPSRHVLIMRYADVPGMIGRFGTILGEVSVNIADMNVGRTERGRDATVILTLDDPVPDAALQILEQSRGINYIRKLSL